MELKTLKFQNLELASDLVDTLFTPGGTADGEYKIKADGVLVSDHQGPRVFIKFNGSNPFVVSCSAKARGVWYSFGLSERDRVWIGLSKSLVDQHSELRAFVEKL